MTVSSIISMQRFATTGLTGLPIAQPWKRYVDDSLVIIKKHSVASFHDTLNSVDPKISFTIEPVNNGQIPFLDTLVSRSNGVRI